MTDESTRPAGRRERNKEEKRSRIFDAAARLFDRDGFAAVTTQQIADEADVAAGTVFRYAATKAELLVMVYNDKSAQSIQSGIDADDPDGPAADRALRLVTPLVRAGRNSDENTLVYQREILFGDPGERYRAEGLELFVALRERIAATLRDSWLRANPGASPAPDSAAAARAIFAAMHLAIADAAITATSTDDLLTDLAADFEVIARGYLTTPTTSEKEQQ
ncbi:TetR/AcrR family transcriptional regulator [Leifsonia poae]|uniref:HTH tetR-type domain-containing protein n=1 Tax=Leifsonia poae TaxID=110933 RepID=A0A9W6HA34_9MICO|nr:TetR/AcrR family transcriptional regulator [Leifsonia poae]GLJ76293.1 hypothetical protein GCM10017584_18670 [Leifsonia poae]